MIARKELNSDENCDTKSFKNHYKRVPSGQFKEMQDYLRGLVKKECLRKFSNPYLMLKEFETEGQNSLLGQLCQEFQTSTPLSRWSKTKNYMLIDIQSGY